MQSIDSFRRTTVAALLLLGFCATAAAQARVEKNVVYGMYSGAALLLDIHYPARPNGFGIVFIAGSGWNARLGYSAVATEGIASSGDVRALPRTGRVHGL